MEIEITLFFFAV